MPSRPDKVYAEDWVGWDEFLGVLLPFEEARRAVHMLNIQSQEEWWELVSTRPTFVASLRVPARPHLFFKERWQGYDDWLGLEPTQLFVPKFDD